MKVKHNPRQVKHLLRVLDTLNGFELVICGYQSLSVFHEMLDLVRNNCRVRKIDAIDIDVSSLSRVRGFEKLLRKSIGRGKQYLVFNIIGLEHHVKANEVSSFLNHINLIRDKLASDFPYGFFFWLPEILAGRFALDAPDLWAWRNTVAVFEDEEREGEIIDIPIKSNVKEDFENFTLKEKQRQVEYLQDAVRSIKKKKATLKWLRRLSQLYTDLGELQYLIGNYDAALKQHRESLEIREKIGDIKGVSDSLLNIGVIYQYKGHYDAALIQYQKAKEIFEKIGDIKGVSYSLHNIGIIYQYKGDYDATLKQYQKSMEIKEKIGDIKGVSYSLHNIGIIYQYKGDYDAALKQYQKALEISEKIADIKGISDSLHQIGMVYQNKGDYDEALKQYQKSMEIKEKIGDIKGVSSSLHNIGAIYQDKGDYDEALKQYRMSMEIKEKIGDIAGSARSMTQLGTLYFQQNKFVTALEYFIRAFLVFEKIGSPHANQEKQYIARVREKLPGEQFNATLKKFNLTPEFFDKSG